MSDLNSLLNQGIEAARAGDRAGARKLFEQVLEQDEENVKAWLLLYRVVDNEDEKRICLTTVLRLDPNNERAKQALAKLDAKAEKTKADEEVLPGVSRRQLTLIVGVAAGVVLVIIVVVVLIVSSRNSAVAAQQAELARLKTNDANATRTIEYEQTQEAMAATQTQVAMISPTPTATATSNRPTLPPEFTPTPSPTEITAATALAFPDGIPGSIVGWSGRDIENNDFLPIVLFPVSGRGQFTRIGEQTGRYPAINPISKRIIYTRYFPTTFDYGLAAVNSNGTQAEDLSQRWRPYGMVVFKSEMPTFTADGNRIAFVAVSQDSSTSQLYVLDLTIQGSNPITQLTNDAATYRWPAISPDGSRVAVVRNDKNSPTPGEDIVVIEVATRNVRAITTDLSSFVESAPRWSPDGSKIAYSAAPATAPDNNDIVIINADGSGTPALPVRSASNDIFPIYSPDGRYLAFSSNRTGYYDIFIYEFSSGTLWQLTSSPEEDYPGGWAND